MQTRARSRAAEFLHIIYTNSGGYPSNSAAKSGARPAKSGGRLFQHKKLGRPSLRPSLKGTRPSLYKLYGESKLGRPSLRPSLRPASMTRGLDDPLNVQQCMSWGCGLCSLGSLPLAPSSHRALESTAMLCIVLVCHTPSCHRPLCHCPLVPLRALL